MIDEYSFEWLFHSPQVPGLDEREMLASNATDGSIPLGLNDVDVTLVFS